MPLSKKTQGITPKLVIVESGRAVAKWMVFSLLATGDHTEAAKGGETEPRVVDGRAPRRKREIWSCSFDFGVDFGGRSPLPLYRHANAS